MPLTYKNVSDLVTERNYDQIIKEVSDCTFEDSIRYGGNQDMYIQELTEAQTKAVENYRRRIYDAWSVLRALNIIAPTNADPRLFQYNNSVLEGALGQQPQMREVPEGNYTGGLHSNQRMENFEAEKLARIQEFISRFQATKEKERYEAN